MRNNVSFFVRAVAALTKGSRFFSSHSFPARMLETSGTGININPPPLSMLHIDCGGNLGRQVVSVSVLASLFSGFTVSTIRGLFCWHLHGAVTLHITPKYGSGSFLNASYVSGDINQATWQVTTTLPQGFCVLQARATAP